MADYITHRDRLITGMVQTESLINRTARKWTAINVADFHSQAANLISDIRAAKEDASEAEWQSLAERLQTLHTDVFRVFHSGKIVRVGDG